MEHSPMRREHAAELVGVAAGAGLAPFVRVDAIERSPVLKMLDVGRGGADRPRRGDRGARRSSSSSTPSSPRSATAATARAATAAGAWPSATPTACTAIWSGPTANTLLLPQCETPGCLENIDEISRIDGVDGIFIGPFDLSIALGIPGSSTTSGT